MESMPKAHAELEIIRIYLPQKPMLDVYKGVCLKLTSVKYFGKVRGKGRCYTEAIEKDEVEALSTAAPPCNLLTPFVISTLTHSIHLH